MTKSILIHICHVKIILHYMVKLVVIALLLLHLNYLQDHIANYFHPIETLLKEVPDTKVCNVPNWYQSPTGIRLTLT